MDQNDISQSDIDALVRHNNRSEEEIEKEKNAIQRQIEALEMGILEKMKYIEKIEGDDAATNKLKDSLNEKVFDDQQKLGQLKDKLNST